MCLFLCGGRLTYYIILLFTEFARLHLLEAHIHLYTIIFCLSFVELSFYIYLNHFLFLFGYRKLHLRRLRQLQPFL